MNDKLQFFSFFQKVRSFVPVLVGFIFAFSGVFKVLYPGEATMSMVSLGVPIAVADTIVPFVTVIELYLAGLLLFRINLQYAIVFLLALMFMFLLYMWYLASLASPPSCGCLGLSGLFISNKQAAVVGVWRNGLMFFSLLWSLDLYSKSPVSVDSEV